MKIMGVILAAGEGRRMGTIKQLLPFNGTTLLGRVISSTRQSMIDDITLVLGCRSDDILRQVDTVGLHVIMNRQWSAGQSGSLTSGLAGLTDEHEAVMFLLADQPLVGPDTIDLLIRRFRESDADIVVPVYKKKRGNPTIFSIRLIPKIRQLKGDTGGRRLFSSHAARLMTVEVDDPAVVLDVDTPGDYQKILAASRAP